MLRSKANNLLIALGLVLLYTAIGDLTSQVRQSPLQYFPKLASNAWLTKAYPEDTSAAVIPEIPPIPEVPLLPETSPDLPSLFKSATFLPFIRTASGSPMPLSLLVPEKPIRMIIPAIHLDAPVVPTKSKILSVNGKRYRQFLPPDKMAIGWHNTSALLGERGNSVFNGHNNIYGEVFSRLIKLQEGDLIEIYSENNVFTYIITNKLLLPEQFEGFDTRMDNAQWILPSSDERVTLITCWPRESNTHRLIIVAVPYR